MYRECEKLEWDSLKTEIKRLIPITIDVEIYVDSKNKKEILDFLRINKDRTRRIFVEILSGRYNNTLYGKEEVSQKAKGITAMKFRGKYNKNTRIYCKEYFFEQHNKKIVMIMLLEKKEFTKKIKKLIEKLGEYEYEFE